MMKCAKCGAELSDSSKYCSVCGASVSQEQGNPSQDGFTESEKIEFVSQGEEQQNQKEYLKSGSEHTQKTGDVSLGIKIKSRLLSWWNELDLFNKLAIISAIFIILLLITSICTKKVWPIVLSSIQIFALVLALLIHKGIIKFNKAWLKYMMITIAILLSVVNVVSYSWGNRDTTKDIPSTSILSPSDQIDPVANTPYDVKSCVGKLQSDVKNDFSSVGFNNISVYAMNDLDLTEAEKEGLVESVTINGIADFEGNQEFPSLSKVLITYHSFKSVGIPFSSESAKTMNTDELLDKLFEAGFTNISTDEVLDLDPDLVTTEFENHLSIEGVTSFDENHKFPINAEIKIITHKAFEKYDVKILIDFVSNLVFSKYDVEFDFAGEVKTLTHGKDAEFAYRIKPGTYSLTFTSVGNSSVKGTADLTIIGETEAAYQIRCSSEKVDVETVYVEDKGTVGEDEAMVPMSASMCQYENYMEIEQLFRNAGFTNITENVLYDIVLGWTDEGEVKSVTIDGKSDFTRGNVFSKDVPIVITYHMPEEDDPSNIQMEKSNTDYVSMDYHEVEQVFQDMGFTNIVCAEKTTSDQSHKNGEVYSVSVNHLSFSAGDKFKPDAQVLITYYVFEAETNPGGVLGDDPSTGRLSYTTNDLETAKKGNSGVYAYKKSGIYDIYYIIDFDEGYVYRFTDGNGENSCDRLQIESGDLNSVVIVTYHDGDNVWSNGLHFCWVNQPDHLILEDNDGFEYDFYPTDLYAAFNIRTGKHIVDY